MQSHEFWRNLGGKCHTCKNLKVAGSTVMGGLQTKRCTSYSQFRTPSKAHPNDLGGDNSKYFKEMGGRIGDPGKTRGKSCCPPQRTREITHGSWELRLWYN